MKLVAMLLAMVALLFAQADSALEKAIRTETLEGNLKGAVEQYKKLAQGKDRAVAARNVVRTAVLLPWSIPTVVAALVWRFMFESPGGIANAGMAALGLAMPTWFADPVAAWLPIVAAVNGVAAGAGSVIALAADLRLLARSASFAFLFTRVGLAGADMGSAYLLPRIVGFGRATELLLLGEKVSAQRALEIGLATEVVPFLTQLVNHVTQLTRASGLTAREEEILACIFHGLQDKEIASALGIGTATVHTHMHQLFEKLGVHSRGEIIAKFLELS